MAKTKDKKSKGAKKAKDNGGAKNKRGKSGANAVATIDWSSYHKHEKQREKDGTGGGQWLKRVKEGDYPFTIKKVELTESSKGNKMFRITFIGKSGKVRGKQTRDYFVFKAEALFKLRELLEALEMDVPKKVGKLTGADLEGKDIGITLGDEEYDGKMQSKAQNYVPITDLTEDDDGDDEGDGDEPDFSSMDLDELVAYNKKNKLGIKGLKNMKLKKARKAVEDANDNEDLESVDLDDM